jgi:hypothetical protein
LFLDDAGERTLELAVRKMGLSARVHDHLLKVARTIADLDHNLYPSRHRRHPTRPSGNLWPSWRGTGPPQPLAKGGFPHTPISLRAGPRNRSTPVYMGVLERRLLPCYAECGGKIVRVLMIEGGKYPKITVELEDTKRRFVGTAYGDSLDSITLLDDLDRARSEFCGTTLWVKQAEALTYDPANNNHLRQMPERIHRKRPPLARGIGHRHRVPLDTSML